MPRHNTAIVDSARLAANLAALTRAGMPIPQHRLLGAADGRIVTVGGSVVDVLVPSTRGEIPLHGHGDPVREALELVPADLANDGLVVVVGAGAGYVLDALARRAHRGRVLVFEPSPVSCLAALARKDWSGAIAARRLGWLLGPAYDGWTDMWSWVTPGDAPAIVIQPVLGRERPGDVRLALETVKRIVFNASANERARRQFAGPYLLNTLENLPHLVGSHDVRALVGRFTDTPVVIAAAGPSLNRNLEELAPLRDRVLLMAVDTALRPCLAAGLEPDLVVAVDPGVLNRRHLTVDPPPVHSWLVSEPSLAPGSFASFGGRVCTFRVGDHEPWPWLLRNGIDRGRLRAWGSVLTTALDLAVQMDGTPIILIGADFGYTNGQPYCRGTAYEDDWAREIATYGSLEAVWEARWRVVATVEEAGLDGHPVRATPQLLAFRDWTAAYCAQQSRRIINCTGAGLMKALPTASLAVALADAPPRRIEMPFGSRHAPFTGFTVEPFDPDADGDWQRWAGITGASPLSLMRLVGAGMSQSPDQERASSSDEFRALPADVHEATRATALWRALHAEGYFEQHPRYRQPMSDIGLATVRQLLGLTRDDVLLDVGCGYGRLLWFLAPCVRRSIAYEVASEPLALARLYLSGRGDVSFVLGDGDRLAAIGDGTVTAVVALTVLPFMSRAGIPRILAEISRVLAPGGRACLQFHHDGPRHVARDDGAQETPSRFSEMRPPAAASHDEGHIRRLMSAAGLVITALVHESLETYHPGDDMEWIWVRCEKPREATRA